MLSFCHSDDSFSVRPLLSFSRDDRASALADSEAAADADGVRPALMPAGAGRPGDWCALRSAANVSAGIKSNAEKTEH